MFRGSTVSIGVLALLLTACAGTPKEPNQYGHQFDYSYKPPAEVSAADAEECGRRANDAAMKEASTVSDRAAIIFGPVGAMVQLSRVKHKLNSTYEEVMKSCLGEKGYELKERALPSASDS